MNSKIGSKTKARSTSKKIVDTDESRENNQEPSVEVIRELAYIIYHERIANGIQSSQDEDWLIAESILKKSEA
ncbi:MAG TPA: hypothetical protein VMT63_07890 [Bacteroidales bacterium]|nr:hypothetical protein [Bacteroidales bacterium]